MKILHLIASAICMLSLELKAEELEVIHWWTSGGEVKSVNSLKKMFISSGHTWKDSKIIGGGGENANKALMQRISSGDSPGVVQLKSASIPHWGSMGALQEVNRTAVNQKWDNILPTEVSRGLKYKGSYVSVPLNVHRINWIWMNAAVMNKINAKAPSSFKELFETLEAIKSKTKVLPIAHGGQSWQDATLFEQVLLAIAGIDTYRGMFIDLDATVAKSAKVLKVFRVIRKLTTFMADDRKGLDWDKATKQVIEGRAAMQFMGDWAKGEFLSAGLQPGRDFICWVTPGLEGFIYTIDAFAFFKTKENKSKQAQSQLAQLIMTKEFQREFNKRKGSIPARTDVLLNGFDNCAKQSAKDFSRTANKGLLAPSFAHGNAQPSDIQGALIEVISLFMSSSMPPEMGRDRLISVLEEFE
ncbi:ABC transporter substrate-binding protein [Pseudobacteriovorax antillogorgiicola]|uniref:Probable sugar-binding periplasmic protein n=1 Tax=Pseudobacteriovorax antillogorgiicola TaxID=1513793 RepID=A0A1Y6BPU6_9BACT|nr:ABC transporter substrate-binding protein [Pseudobacteriovorax antillogorgiicola]TCS55467.1 carbohydrate ABC transporter substrate-binding protein (CUT1 family) [Pseudobacteriovorax antillogorgiicola]SMF12109.1 carbohydrate ABC transporter substrate-binding protein, CUT1 family [Pseudobacteriovorax antillogorgiicola]